MYENYSIFVLCVNNDNRKVIVTLKNRIYQVTVLTVPSRFKFLLTIIEDQCLSKTFITAVAMRCIKLALLYLHVVRQEQLYLI